MALSLNIIAAIYSTWLFNRGRLVDWPKLRPLLVASLPTALAGGLIVLDERIYDVVTGAVLILASFILVLRRSQEDKVDRATPLWGAITVGASVVSGLTGVGGGVFLAPILIALQWASPRQTATLSAPFILANSIVGLGATIYAGQFPAHDTWIYAAAALIGAMIGTVAGLRWLSQRMTRYILAAILGTAGIQLLLIQNSN
jgi:uncharacterized membrane protein YfcA